MTLQHTMSSMATGGLMAFLMMLILIVMSVFWMIVGWRAMKAHEEIADVLRGRTKL